MLLERGSGFYKMPGTFGIQKSFRIPKMLLERGSGIL
jgi:hypothetical protein